MSQPDSPVPTPSRAFSPYGGQGSSTTNLADILERVLDKGIVIVGDIKVNLLDIELLTIKLRLLVASVDKAKEIGIDWWEHDPALSSRAADGRRSVEDADRRRLKEQNERLRAEVEELRSRIADSPAELSPSASTKQRRPREAEPEPETRRSRAPEHKPRKERRPDSRPESRPEDRSADRSAEPRRKRRKVTNDETDATDKADETGETDEDRS